jgi:hypothetical protein
MHHAAPVMGEDQKDEQDLETGGRDGEEIDRDEVLGAIVQEGPPNLKNFGFSGRTVVSTPDTAQEFLNMFRA